MIDHMSLRVSERSALMSKPSVWGGMKCGGGQPLAEAPDAVAQWNQKFTPFSYGLRRESLHRQTAGHNAGESCESPATL